MSFGSTAPKPVCSFVSLAQWPEHRRKWVSNYAVPNPSQCDDWRHLKEKLVRIDGSLFTVVHIEAAYHDPPWRKGERLSLGVNPA
jgi:hypothetical protein